MNADIRTVEMTLDDDLAWAVDYVPKGLRRNCSAFARKAPRKALACHQIEEMEQAHRRVCKQQAVAADEFPVREAELAWGDE